MFQKYPSIEQFRTVVKYVTKYAPELTNIEYEGTVKLHGSNAAVLVTPEGGVFAQSRNRIIDIENDNAGFAKFISDNKDYFLSNYSSTHTVVIYGEWCGEGIQRGVAINKLDRMFVVFSVREVDKEGNKGAELLPSMHSFDHEKIFSIRDFDKWNITIDFSKPDKIVDTLTQLTQQVENQCPVARFFGVEGVGEGIVWKPISVPKNLSYSSMIFKVKGEKHSTSKVKVLVPLTEEELSKKNKLAEFIDIVVTENRVKQAIHETNAVDKKDTGSVIRWVFNDIIKEETPLMLKNDISSKEIRALVAKSAKTIYFALI